MSALLFCLVALGFLGTFVFAIAQGESAREDMPSEERDERAFRNSASRRVPTRAREGGQPVLNFSEFTSPALDLARFARLSRSFIQSFFYPGNLHLLQVRRI
jgi:hypothetical protein